MEDARDTGRRISLIRKATMQDIDAVAQIYEAVHDAEEAGALCIGWDRSVYPVRQTALAALAREDLFVEEEEGAVVGAAIINQTQVPEYALCPWEYPAQENEVMVLHTLVVDPRCSGRGYGTAFVAFYEEYAGAHGCAYLRMDTQEMNRGARRLYAGLGYREPGIVPCVFNGIPDVRLVCLEKKLDLATQAQ